jgi:gliding motility-associated-like protein
VFANPIVKLNKDSALCTSSFKTLDAGNFVSYLWNNGAVTRTIEINNIGIYSVVVTDVNGCRGADTSRITKINSLPGSFLPDAAFICSYGTLDIEPSGNYASYLWNTGAVTKKITVNKPGTYWLQVSDNNRCTGKDTTLISLTDCMAGFYMANAFTPNNDGLNDDIKPLLFGNVVSYEFTIFNRWGEIVFRSNDRFKGWNGFYKGSLQDPATYTWTCVYQLDGQEPTVQKGTLLLIK